MFNVSIKVADKQRLLWCWLIVGSINTCVQEMENKMRNQLNEIYFGKTKDIVNGLRSSASLSEGKQREVMMSDLAEALKHRQPPPANN